MTFSLTVVEAVDENDDGTEGSHTPLEDHIDIRSVDIFDFVS